MGSTAWLTDDTGTLTPNMSPGQWQYFFCTTDASFSTDAVVPMMALDSDGTVPVTPRVITPAPKKKVAEHFINPKCEYCGTRGPDDYYGNCRSCGGPRP